MTPNPQPHCDHEKVCSDLILYLKNILPEGKYPVMKCKDVMQDFQCPHDTRSNPTPSPQKLISILGIPIIPPELIQQTTERMEQFNKALEDHDTQIRNATLDEFIEKWQQNYCVYPEKSCYQDDGNDRCPVCIAEALRSTPKPKEHQQ